MPRFFIFLLLLILQVSFCSADTFPKEQDNPLKEAMERHLSCYPLNSVSLQTQQPVLEHEDICLAAIYRNSNESPLWVTTEGPTEKAHIILEFLENAAAEGLNPEDYNIATLHALWNLKTPNELAQLDTTLTFSVIQYLHDVEFGRISLSDITPHLDNATDKNPFNPIQSIQSLLESNDIGAFLTQAAPHNKYYQGLKKMLPYYQERTALPWAIIEKGPSIKPGMEDRRIPEIGNHLAILQNGKCDEIPDTRNGHLYSNKLEKQIRLFQSFHGLQADGIIGKDTLGELNISPRKRLEQIRLNMARWRWLDHHLNKDYVIVNIANFSMTCFRDGQLQLTLPIIVGMLQHQTPVFSNAIRYVEFNPYWNIPTSIAINEELPRLRKDPYALEKRSIRLFSSWQEDARELDSTMINWDSIDDNRMAKFKLRQEPGPSNALGHFKFVFPNQYAVYLHDTPGKSLFNQTKRFFSHGCIRVSHPERFAEFLLQMTPGKWDKETIRAIIDSEKNKIVHLNTPLPIHITYQTVWLDNDERIHFSKDIYNRDEQLALALFHHDTFKQPADMHNLQ